MVFVWDWWEFFFNVGSFVCRSVFSLVPHKKHSQKTEPSISGILMEESGPEISCIDTAYVRENSMKVVVKFLGSSTTIFVLVKAYHM